MFTAMLGIGALIASAIYGKYQADQQSGAIDKAQREAQKKQEEILKAKGPEATQSNDTYNSLMDKRGDIFKKGLMSTIKTSNFGLLDTGNSGKTKLGQ